MRCINPFIADGAPVPCNKCIACRRRKISEWCYRLQKQLENSESAWFLTLTYDTRYIPITDCGYLSLQKKDVQDFMKRLRKRSEKKLKYYYCGEYGTDTDRPHYHMILFNAELQDIEDSWQLGSVHYGDVSPASITYTLKYMYTIGKVPVDEYDERMPEFSNMSKGLGIDYLTPEMIKWHEDSLVNRVYIPIEDGKKIPLPRYYRDKIYSLDQKSRIQNVQVAKNVFEAENDVKKIIERSEKEGKTVKEIRKEIFEFSNEMLHIEMKKRNKL